jgi:hypothetical protein
MMLIRRAVARSCRVGSTRRAFFSTESDEDPVALAKAAEAKELKNAHRIEQEHFVRDKTVTPWTARTTSPAAAVPEAPPGQVAQLAGIPNAIKSRVATIYRPARSQSTTGTQNTKAWKLEFANKPRWVNHLMGWYSSGDPVGQFSMRFESSEQAAKFCEKMGYGYEIKGFNTPANFHGRKSYSYNFLAEDVEKNMKVRGRRHGQKWFGHAAGRQSGWVNVGRSDYGKSDPYLPDANKDVAKAAPKVF